MAEHWVFVDVVPKPFSDIGFSWTLYGIRGWEYHRGMDWGMNWCNRAMWTLGAPECINVKIRKFMKIFEKNQNVTVLVWRVYI